MPKLRRRVQKNLSQDELERSFSEKYLECSLCGISQEVRGNITGITCARCVQKMVAPPDFPVKPKPAGERKPRGWQFMKEFVDHDGIVYHKGKAEDKKKSKPKQKTVKKKSSTTVRRMK